MQIEVSMTTNAPCDSLLISIPWLSPGPISLPFRSAGKTLRTMQCVITLRQSERMQDKMTIPVSFVQSQSFAKKGVLFKPRCMRMNGFTWNLILINIPSPPCMQLTPGLEIGCNSVFLVNLIKAVQNRQKP